MWNQFSSCFPYKSQSSKNSIVCEIISDCNLLIKVFSWYSSVVPRNSSARCVELHVFRFDWIVSVTVSAFLIRTVLGVQPCFRVSFCISAAALMCHIFLVSPESDRKRWCCAFFSLLPQLMASDKIRWLGPHYRSHRTLATHWGHLAWAKKLHLVFSFVSDQINKLLWNYPGDGGQSAQGNWNDLAC